MYRASDSDSPLASIPFYVALVFLGAYIIVNLFIAVVKVGGVQCHIYYHPGRQVAGGQQPSQ